MRTRDSSPLRVSAYAGWSSCTQRLVQWVRRCGGRDLRQRHRNGTSSLCSHVLSLCLHPGWATCCGAQWRSGVQNSCSNELLHPSVREEEWFFPTQENNINIYEILCVRHWAKGLTCIFSSNCHLEFWKVGTGVVSGNSGTRARHSNDLGNFFVSSLHVFAGQCHSLPQ